MAVKLNHTPPLNHYNTLPTILPSPSYALVPSFTLSSGTILLSVLLVYKTWGTLNAAGTNVIINCHALSSTCDLEVDETMKWIIGPGRPFDTDRFFVVSMGNLGNPYGSEGSLTWCKGLRRCWGGEFPETTVRDDVRIHNLLLSTLGVTSILATFGTSVGSMTA